jgi:hypothetical protein
MKVTFSLGELMLMNLNVKIFLCEHKMVKTKKCFYIEYISFQVTTRFTKVDCFLKILHN